MKTSKELGEKNKGKKYEKPSVKQERVKNMLKFSKIEKKDVYV